jgi:hypothetical protein
MLVLLILLYILCRVWVFDFLCTILNLYH